MSFETLVNGIQIGKILSTLETGLRTCWFIIQMKSVYKQNSFVNFKGSSQKRVIPYVTGRTFRKNE